MSSPVQLSARPWIIVPFFALGFLLWINLARVQHLDFVSALVTEAPALDPASATGYAGGTRTLVVPAHNGESYDWIVQAQRTLRTGDWRIRHVDYENAPFGRDVASASPYRWWLAFVARLEHAVSGRPLGQSAERAAVYADPLLHGLLLVGATVFVGWQFGAFAAAMISIGIAFLFPFAAGFIPGAPDAGSLAQAVALGGTLLLLAGIRALFAPAQDPQARRWFFCAGVAGGFGLWISPGGQLPILLGIVAGALLSAKVSPHHESSVEERARWAGAWRAWGLGGAGIVLLGYLVEFFPANLGQWQLQSVHPLYAIAWLGAADLLARRGAEPRNRRAIGVVLAVAAVAALPLALWLTDSHGILAAGRYGLRLTKLPQGGVGTNFFAWAAHDGGSTQVWATALPLLVVALAIGSIAKAKSDPVRRTVLLVALGPTIVTLGLALVYLRWWHALDGALLALLIAACANGSEPASAGRQWRWLGLTCLLVIPGVLQLLPPTGAAARTEIPTLEVDGLVERDLARWLARRTGGGPEVVVWAPPGLANTLQYYGGLRGIGSLAQENAVGLTAAIRLARATSTEAAEALIRSRGITHLVLPSWDSYFDDYVRGTADNPEAIFLGALHRWQLPPWLRAVPYQFSRIAGIENYSVQILEVVDDQEDSVALSRLAEYFAEMGQLDYAASVGRALQKYPADLGTLIARAQVSAARGETDELARVIAALRARLDAGADKFLPWDRRVSLAIVLAREQEIDRATAQLGRCLTELTEPRLRSLSPGMLFNLQALASAAGMEITDQRLRVLARELLPLELRTRL